MEGLRSFAPANWGGVLGGRLRVLRWLTELRATHSKVPLVLGLVPLVALRLELRSRASVSVRNFVRLRLPDVTSASVFANIWIREIYPAPDAADVVLDLGANIGLFTLFALKAGAAHIYSVEPCPDSVDQLEAHLELAGAADMVSVLQAAIGETAGTAFIPAKNGVKNQLSTDELPGSVSVRVLDACDELMETLPRPPSYIKIDIEANEEAVLRRLIQARSFSSVRTVAIEAYQSKEEMAAALTTAGFQVRSRMWPESLMVATRSAKT